MIFNMKEKRKLDIEWKDGAVIQLDIPFYSDLISEVKNYPDISSFTYLVLERSIIGWTGIVDSENNEIKLKKETLKPIANALLLDLDFKNKLDLALGSPIVNLVLGSIAEEITDGQKAVVKDVQSKKKT